MSYIHDSNSIKASLNQSLINPNVMELIPDLRVVWMDAVNFDPNTMEICGCAQTFCATTYCALGYSIPTV